MVSYTVSHTIRENMYRNTNVSVWYVCNTRDPFDAKKGKEKSMMEFTTMVSFQGSYYAMSLQGTVAVMKVDEAPRDHGPRLDEGGSFVEL